MQLTLTRPLDWRRPLWHVRWITPLAAAVLVVLLAYPAMTDALRPPIPLTLTCERCISAHRGDIGSPDSQPENTLPAITQAAEKGADIVEIDVLPSAEGTWWVMHDDTVDRTTNGSGLLVEMTDDEIATLRIDGGLGYRSDHATNLGIPRLTEVFDAMRHSGALIQVSNKDRSDVTTPDLARLVVEHGAQSMALVRVYTREAAAAVKAVDPSLFVIVRHNAPATLEGDLNVDLWAATIDDFPSADAVTALTRPLQVRPHTRQYGSDESAWIRSAFGHGARVFMTNHLDRALHVRDHH